MSTDNRWTKPYLEELPPDIYKDINHLLQVIQAPTTANNESTHIPTMPQKIKSLQDLCEYFRQEKYQYAVVANRDLRVILTFMHLFKENIDRLPIIYYATTCIWYLSRNSEATCYLCRPVEDDQRESEFPHSIISYLLFHYRHITFFNIDINIANALSNCCLQPENHPNLLDPSLQLMEIVNQELTNHPDNSRHYRTLGCLASALAERHLPLLLEYPFIERMSHRLVLGGWIPADWHDRLVGGEVWSLYCLLFLSCLPSARERIRSMNLFDYLYTLMGQTTIDAVNSMIILVNLYTDCNPELLSAHQTQQFHKLLIQYPLVLLHLCNIMQLTIAFDPASELFTAMSEVGFAYGMLKVHVQILAIKLLSLSSVSNYSRIVLVRKCVFRYLQEILRKFIENESECMATVAYSIEESGGGGKDSETILQLLELCLIWINYDISNLLDLKLEDLDRREQLIMDLTPMIPLLTQLMEVPLEQQKEERNLTDESIAKIRELGRLIVTKYENEVREVNYHPV